MKKDNEARTPTLYCEVTLTKDVKSVFGDKHTFEAGSRGQVVEIHANGEAYEVEFTSPFAFLTVMRDELIV